MPVRGRLPDPDHLVGRVRVGRPVALEVPHGVGRRGAEEAAEVAEDVLEAVVEAQVPHLVVAGAILNCVSPPA